MMLAPTAVHTRTMEGGVMAVWGHRARRVGDTLAICTRDPVTDVVGGGVRPAGSAGGGREFYRTVARVEGGGESLVWACRKAGTRARTACGRPVQSSSGNAVVCWVRGGAGSRCGEGCGGLKLTGPLGCAR